MIIDDTTAAACFQMLIREPPMMSRYLLSYAIHYLTTTPTPNTVRRSRVKDTR